MLLGASAEAMHIHAHSSQTQPLSKKTGTCLICHAPGIFLNASSAVTHGIAFTMQGATLPVISEYCANTSILDLFVRPPPNLSC